MGFIRILPRLIPYRTMINYLTSFRRLLHTHPDLSGHETQTARRIVDFSRQYAPTRVLEQLGGNGVAVVYDFGADGPTLLFRCELDALPIAEINTFDHRSVTAGVSHKCGHDGHMAIVAGLMPVLQRARYSAGRVVLLFQPAEETGKGAAAVLADPRFRYLQPDYVFALHNVPGFPMHQVRWVAEQFSPTVQSIAIRLFGKESHASEPENGINPARAIANLLQQFERLSEPDRSRADFALATPVHVLLGQPQYGISAGYGELHFTLRTWSQARMDALVESINRLLADECAKERLRFESEWFDYFPATINDDTCNQLIVQAGLEAGVDVVQQPVPFKFGEDFGWLTQQYRGAMFGLGAGEMTPALHNPDYDFPDELIATGVDLFTRIIQQVLAPLSIPADALPPDTVLISRSREAIGRTAGPTETEAIKPAEYGI